MRSPSVRHMFLVWPFVLFVAGCSLATLPIRPPEPEHLPPARNPEFSVTDSVIEVPVRADLTPLLTAANDDRIIAKTFDHWQSYVKGAKGVDYKYYAERDDFSTTTSASGVSSRPADSAVLRDWWKGVERAANVFVSAPLRYKIGAAAHAGSGSGPLQCGDGTQWPRRAMMHGDFLIDLTPEYGVTSSVTGVAVNPVDPCVLEVAGVDVAKDAQAKLADMARGGLNDALTRITTVNFKHQVEEAWNALRNPIPLKPGVWLMLNVEQIGHAGFSGQGSVVNDTIQMRVNPIIVRGDEPAASDAVLPQLTPQPAGKGFRIVVDTQLDYAVLSDMLADRLKGKRIANEGDTIVITNASISGMGGNRVMIRIDFRGDARGHAYFVGRPQLNLLTQTIYLSDLRYDVETARLLQKSAEWIYKSNFREFIASETVLGVTSATIQVHNLLAPVVMRRLSPAVTMDGRVTSVQGISAFADVNALSIRSMAEGSLNVTVAAGP